jgi:nickel-dependent lactate racemase
MIEVSVPTLLWYGDTSLHLRFPSEWKVKMYPMDGDNLQPLDDEGIKAALSNPIGSKTVGELAKTRKEAVIVIDDMTRPTRAYQIIPFLLKELNDNGISNDHIRFIMALGMHGAADRVDFVKKLGEDVVEQFPVYNHNPFGYLTHVGDTSRGTPVHINSEFMACDLRIAIGCIVPHPITGFGGGPKIILPGIAGFNTIRYNHTLHPRFLTEQGQTAVEDQPSPSAGWGKLKGNVPQLDAEEAAKLAGLNVKIDAILNGRCQTSGLSVGDVSKAFNAGVKRATKVYATQTPKDVDIVVANTFAKSNEAGLAMWLAERTVREDGTVVLIANAPDGQCTHYFYGKFGKKIGGRQFRGKRYPKIGKLIVYSQYPEKEPLLVIGAPNEMIWLKEWNDVIEELQKTHSGTPTVAIYPTTEIQVPPEEIRF